MDERELGTAVEEHSGGGLGGDDAGPPVAPGIASETTPEGTAVPAGTTAETTGASAAGPHPEEAAEETDQPTTERVLDALKQVVDPELGINIVDLGLVYDVSVSAEGDVDIQYTLTTMGCPIGPMIEDQMRAFLAPVPGVNEVRPEMVLRPPWTPEMMSDEAKAALGVF
jgi:metal-sulfur cluster biosynthetic enzyme